MEAPPKVSVWGTRFAWMAMVHALLFLLVTALIAVPSALSALGIKTFSPSIGQVIAGGSAGTWFVMGYVFYFLVGVVAMGLFAAGYHVLEDYAQKKVEGRWKWAAWTHLVGMNTGIAAAGLILMYAGYFGGAMVLAKKAYAETHGFLAPLGTYAGVSVLVLVVGVMAGLVLFGMKMGGPRGLAEVWYHSKARALPAA